MGYAINTSDILASGTGSFALGRAGNTSNILASGSGSLAFGNANSSGNIASSGNGTFAFGNIAGSANITAGAGAGAFAGGSCSTTFAITASAEGSFAFGKTDTAAIVASATNAVQFGPGTNSIANSLQVGTKWSARASGATGSGKESKTLGVGATTLAVTSSFVVVTGNGGGNTLADITGGFDGMRLVLLFVDSLVTITDTDAHTANTVDLSAAFTSADDTILELISDGTSWYEISRSVN
ncbi:MAG: hypothetical protein Q8S00_32615 [Deltaproteobacteria bacterium]|nr:hypothetical protein [Deltaproteobacteria bacterium]